MLTESMRESAVPTGVFLPPGESREQKLERLRADFLQNREPDSREIADAMVKRALAHGAAKRARFTV